VFDTEPTHDWHQFTREDKLNTFCNITEKLPIKQDARLLAGVFTENFTYQLDTLRKYYLYVVTGTVTVNDIDLIEGDGLSFSDESNIRITNPNESEIILFDLK
jgi:redox-sensitive bicupin YhaK (pirin superfamily)